MTRTGGGPQTDGDKSLHSVVVPNVVIDIINLSVFTYSFIRYHLLIPISEASLSPRIWRNIYLIGQKNLSYYFPVKKLK